MVAELNSTPEPVVSIAMCVIAITTILKSLDLSKWLKKGKVIAMKLWNWDKGQTVAAASVWILAGWGVRTAAESG